METNKVSGKLTEFARLLSLIVGREDFFLCWEDTDREQDELENSENGETIPAETVQKTFLASQDGVFATIKYS